MLNVVVQNVSLVEGMAGSMRVKNILEPLLNKKMIFLSNLALTHTYEKDKIGQYGITETGIKYLYIGYQSAVNLSEVRQFYTKGFEFLKENFRPGMTNIIYNYGYPDVKNLLLINRAKKLGYKVVFDIVEDNRYAKKFSGFLGWLRMKSSIILLKRVRTLAHGVIVISKHLEDVMNDICKNDIPVFNIPITVDLKYFPLKEWVPNPHQFKIFYGGSFFLGKDGMEYLIEAFKRVVTDFPGLSLLLSGKSVVKEEMDKVMGLISDCPQISYLGYLNTDEYFSVLNSCDIFCMPRNNSMLANAGFPFKLGEFLATGKAVIATEVGDVPLYLTNGVNALLIKPESVSELMEAIKFCIQNPEKIIQMGMNARQLCEENFSSTALSVETYNALSNLSRN